MREYVREIVRKLMGVGRCVSIIIREWWTRIANGSFVFVEWLVS